MSIVNGSYHSEVSTTLILEFTPQGDMEIPAYEVEIDGKMHYLGEWELAGKSHQSYFVCDRRSCVKISAMEVDFVRGIIEQFSSKTLYDIE